MKPIATQAHHAADEGFALAELVVAIAVIFVVCLGVMSAVGFSATSLRNSAMRDAAMAVATFQVENARSLPLDSVAIGTSTFTTATPMGNVNVSQVTSYAIDTYDPASVRYNKANKVLAKQVVVTVSWTSGIPGNVKLDTLLTGLAVTDSKLTK
jgi:type II secretory pathway pseudopilin PulG